MFCIAAFIILAILGIFSARYRRLAAEAWKCVARKTTLRKCDTNFKQDIKARLLGKLVVSRPRLARFLSRWIEVLAFAFVVLTIWSLFTVIHSGLNLYVYNTCNPSNSESCSLGAEACSIDTAKPSFWQSLKGGHLLSWSHRQVNDYGETFSRLPDRLKHWQPQKYTSSTSSYYNRFDPSKPTALEIVDPGCKFCAKLFKNIKQAGVEDRYNLTYLVYPIPNAKYPGTYKFPHSYMVATYLESIKRHPLKNAAVSADWQVLERIFTWNDPVTGFGYQGKINTEYSKTQVESLLQKWLINIGYSDEQVHVIVSDTKSQAVAESIAYQRQVVEKQIKTVKIPTLLLDSRRFDGVVGADKLQ